LLATASSRSAGIEVLEPVFLDQILEPYRPTRTDYLKSASVVPSGRRNGAPVILTLRGLYRIPSSCYIRSTGHFNAVEFLICYNQLAYLAFAHIIRTRMIEDVGLASVSAAAREQLSRLTYDDFRRQQLASMLIVKTTTRFKAPISPERFTGELRVQKLFYRNRTCYATSSCAFEDDRGGHAEGEVLLAYPLDGNEDL
jgi:(3R)-3-[(carboxylmethyl)amino]fatty acid synthase